MYTTEMQDNTFTRFTAALNAIATLWIFFLMFLMTGDVIGRVLFNYPITGTPELVKISIVAIVFLQMPHTLLTNRHIRSDIIMDRVSPRNALLLQLMACVAGGLIFLFIFIASWPTTVTSWKLLEFEGEGALRVPVYPIRSIILLGSLLTSIIFSIQAVQAVRKLRNHRKRAA